MNINFTNDTSVRHLLFSISTKDYLQLFSFGVIFRSNTNYIYITAGIVVDLLTPSSTTLIFCSIIDSIITSIVVVVVVVVVVVDDGVE